MQKFQGFTATLSNLILRNQEKGKMITRRVREDVPKKTKRQAAKAKVEEKIEETIWSLKEKHGKDYTVMQYHIWGEMVGGGLHFSLDTAPATSINVYTCSGQHPGGGAGGAHYPFQPKFYINTLWNHPPPPPPISNSWIQHAWWRCTN